MHADSFVRSSTLFCFSTDTEFSGAQVPAGFGFMPNSLSMLLSTDTKFSGVPQVQAASPSSAPPPSPPAPTLSPAPPPSDGLSCARHQIGNLTTNSFPRVQYNLGVEAVAVLFGQPNVNSHLINRPSALAAAFAHETGVELHHPSMELIPSPASDGSTNTLLWIRIEHLGGEKVLAGAAIPQEQQASIHQNHRPHTTHNTNTHTNTHTHTHTHTTNETGQVHYNMSYVFDDTPLAQAFLVSVLAPKEGGRVASTHGNGSGTAEADSVPAVPVPVVESVPIKPTVMCFPSHNAQRGFLLWLNRLLQIGYGAPRPHFI